MLDYDHKPGARCTQHERRETRRERGVTEVVGAELELESLLGPGERRQHHARVVDEQIEPVVRYRESIRKGRNGVEVGKIERLERGCTLGLLGKDLLERELAFARVPAREHHVCAAEGEHSRCLEADAGVGPGHNSGASGLIGDVIKGPGFHEQTPDDGLTYRTYLTNVSNIV
jgi:hypothetical protein